LVISNCAARSGEPLHRSDELYSAELSDHQSAELSDHSSSDFANGQPSFGDHQLNYPKDVTTAKKILLLLIA